MKLRVLRTAEMITFYAMNEQNMNAVERVLQYTKLPQEGKRAVNVTAPATWPSKGSISFKEVDLVYREGLPLVLKKVTFEVKPGEKVRFGGQLSLLV